jgi:hypothetical protein
MKPAEIKGWLATVQKSRNCPETQARMDEEVPKNPSLEGFRTHPRDAVQ